MQNQKITTSKIIFLATFVLFLLFSFSGLVSAAGSNCTPTPDPDDNDDCKYEGQKCVEQTIGGTPVWRCARALEIVYPNIPGQPVPETVATGLPEYFKYIFQLAVVVIGFVIFGVFVYSGTKYLASAGNPSMLSDAKTGMGAALLGAVILLGSWLIFNTINPQLTVLTLPDPKILEQVVSAGVYVCNYDYNAVSNSVINQAVSDGIIANKDFGTILTDYIDNEGEKQIEVAKLLQAIVINPDDRSKKCLKSNYSGNFQNFKVKDNFTMFVVPSIRYSLNTTTGKYEKMPLYEYGIILHEKDDFGGACTFFPGSSDPTTFLADIYTHYTNHPSTGELVLFDTPYPATRNNPVLDYTVGDLAFDAESITIFKAPPAKLDPASQGLIMHMCLDWDRTGMCPGFLPTDADGNPDYSSCTPAGEPVGPIEWPPYVDGSGFKLSSECVSTTQYGMRSVKLDPKNLVFAVFIDDKGNCAVVKNDNPDITNIRLNQCDAGPGAGAGTCNKVHNFLFFHWGGETEQCVPCIQGVLVFKGQVL